MDFFLSIFVTLLLWHRALVRSQPPPGPPLPNPDWDTVCTNKKAQVANGYTVVEDSAFKLNMTAITWNDARQACVDEGGHLAAVDTVGKRSMMRELYRRTNGKSAFVGLHDLYQEGEWVTVLDEAPRWDLYGWGPTHDDENDQDQQNCGRIVQGFLDDYYCSEKLPFICQISLTHCDLSLYRQ